MAPRTAKLTYEDALDQQHARDHSRAAAKVIYLQQISRPEGDMSVPSSLPSTTPRLVKRIRIDNEADVRHRRAVEADSCRSLFLAALSLALHDAHHPNATEADRRWLTSKDFYALCNLAGVDSDFLRRAADAETQERWGARAQNCRTSTTRAPYKARGSKAVTP